MFKGRHFEMVHMMMERQARYAFNPAPSLAEWLDILATWLLEGPAPLTIHMSNAGLRQSQFCPD
jgi:hypothetical protein